MHVCLRMYNYVQVCVNISCVSICKYVQMCTCLRSSKLLVFDTITTLYFITVTLPHYSSTATVALPDTVVNFTSVFPYTSPGNIDVARRRLLTRTRPLQPAVREAGAASVPHHRHRGFHTEPGSSDRYHLVDVYG